MKGTIRAPGRSKEYFEKFEKLEECLHRLSFSLMSFVEGYRSFLQGIGPSQDGLDVIHCIIGVLGMIVSGGVETAQRSNETHWDQVKNSSPSTHSGALTALFFLVPIAAETLTYCPIPVNIIAASIRMNLHSHGSAVGIVFYSVYLGRTCGIVTMAVITYVSLWISPFVVTRSADLYFLSNMEWVIFGLTWLQGMLLFLSRFIRIVITKEKSAEFFRNCFSDDTWNYIHQTRIFVNIVKYYDFDEAFRSVAYSRTFRPVRRSSLQLDPSTVPDGFRPLLKKVSSIFNDIIARNDATVSITRIESVTKLTDAGVNARMHGSPEFQLLSVLREAAGPVSRVSLMNRYPQIASKGIQEGIFEGWLHDEHGFLEFLPHMAPHQDKLQEILVKAFADLETGRTLTSLSVKEKKLLKRRGMIVEDFHLSGTLFQPQEGISPTFSFSLQY